MSKRHVYPINDEREHITDGEPCPCLARTSFDDPDVIVHNSYDGREIGEVVRMALDKLYPDDPETDYIKQHALDLVNMHYPAK